MSGPSVKGFEECKNILVGDKVCSFVKVRDILDGSVSAIVLYRKLLDVARSLDIPSEKQAQLQHGLNTDTITYPEALYQILESWREKVSDHATLHSLLLTLEQNGLNDCAVALQTRISIGKKVVLFQGQQVRLEDVFSNATGNIEEELLTQLVRNEVPELVNNQVPDKLKYYIQRKVVTRNILEKGVLQGNHNDVFLIEGIQKYELTKLVGKNATTDVSGNQILQLTVRFIHLQHHGDFDKICLLASTPVHWLKYHDNCFLWIKSSGSVEALQGYVEKEQDSFDEDNLVSNKEKVVVISDSPGMGKTILLHSIAHELMKHTPTVLVRFIVFKELVEALEGNEIKQESLVKTIAEQSSEYEYGRELVAHALKTSECMLLFDGFDEVFPNQIHSAEQILTVAVSLKSTRVFITTRPHMGKALENTLHVLGHTIKPFQHEDQMEFLRKFWSLHGATSNESLQQFATACLETLNTKIADFEREIAGIPLQCRLLAEVYAEHAIRCSDIGYEAHKESIDMAVITSMFDMYDLHMKMRFGKIRANEPSSNRFKLVKLAHMRHALHVLFPEHVDQVQLSDESKLLGTEQLFSLGIVEDAQSGRFRFVHRTFAEYLVAWFVVEVGVTSREFILSQIFGNKPNQIYWKLSKKTLRKAASNVSELSKTLTTRDILPERVEEYIVKSGQIWNPFDNLKEVKSFEFNFPVICYFINGFAQKQKKKKSNVSVPSIMGSNLYNQVAPVFTASAYHNYTHIPAFVASCFGEDVIIKTQNNNISDLLIVTAKQSGVEMMKIFCSGVNVCSIKFLITETSTLSLKFMITPLHVAVRRGHYQAVEYLLKKFEGNYHKLQYLIHFSVLGSEEDSKSTLKDKKDIIRLLMEKNKRWADEPLWDKSTPLLQIGVNLELMECLIKLGADVNVKDDQNNNLLHRVFAMNSSLEYFRFPISPESYHQILLTLQKHDFQHFNTANEENVTPLQCSIQKIRLLEESVRIFHSTGADFNAVDKQGNSLLFYAIRGGVRSLNLIPLMIELGAEMKHTNLKRQGVLHICANEGNYGALQFFLENYEIDVNAEDIHDCSPLHYAVMKSSETCKSMQMLLINKGATVMARDEMNMTPFDKAFAEGKGISLDVIQAIEKRGLQISHQLASKSLTQVLLNDTYLPSDLDEDYANMLEYLIGKGGEADFQFTQNLWEWEGVQKKMPDITKYTVIRTSLIEKAKSCGLFERLKKGQLFYDVVKEKAGSFERVFMVMVADEQYAALGILVKCLNEAKEKLCSIIFASLPSGVEEFIKSDYLRVFVLQTRNADLSIKRIQDNISKDATVVEEDDLANQIQEEWVIVKCEVFTDELFNTLVRMSSRVLCICSSVARKTGSIVRDTFTWEDISAFYIDKAWFRRGGGLYNIAQLFLSTETIIPTIWNVVGELKSNAYFEIAKFSVGHQIGNPDDCIYLSTTIFHYFILDKLAFVGINLEELNDLAKYGQKVGSFGEDIQKLDYMLLEEKNQFQEICRNTDYSVHLIEYHEGQLKLLQTRGSHKHIHRFFEEKFLCRDFPSCNCSSEVVYVNLSLRLEEEDGGELLSCSVNVTQIKPLMLQILNIQDSIQLYELRKLYQDLIRQDSTSTEEANYKPPFSNHIVQLVEDIVKHLECLDDERKVLQRVAVNTLFPEVESNIDGSIITRFMDLLEKKNGSLVFHNHTLASYFVAEIVVHGNQLECEYVNEIRDAILSDCFQPNKIQVLCNWWEDSIYSSGKIKTFRFSNDMMFKFIESHLSDDADTTWLENPLIPKPKISLPELAFDRTHNFPALGNLGISTGTAMELFQTQNKRSLNNDFMTKCVHACVFGNHRKLLTINLELIDHTQLSNHIVVLAVMYSVVETIELVSQTYFRETKEKLVDITLKFRNDKTGLINPVTLLHIAALRGNASIFQYLLNNFGSKQTLNEPILKNILHFCVIDTLKCEREVEERKKLIESILKVQPNLINARYLHATPLLVPNINISLLMHLVNLGADKFASDASSQNILHLSSQYMTPEEYHQLVNYHGHSKLLHAKSDDKSTPLHTAVKYLEILDTTIEIFSSANIDINAVDDEENTVLMQGIISGRSARLLDSLITSGSDVDVEKYNIFDTTLHLAARHGNLSGVRYFIFCGIDVNTTNYINFTPLHSALYHCKQKTPIHGIVQSLVEYGADVNSIALNEVTPLTYALQRHKNGKIEDRTIEFLKERGAEEFAALKNVNSRFQKLQMEIIDKNMKKLVDNTTCRMILLDKLTDRGTHTETDIEELNTETDGKTHASMLYQMLRRKPNLLEYMTVLHENNQTEPFNLILTETLNSGQVKNLLQYAAINMEYDAVEDLVKAQGLSSLLFDPYLERIIHDCMDSFKFFGPMLDDKVRVIDLILGINQGLVNSRNKGSRTPLHEAILKHSHKQLELIRLLINHKADVNARNSTDHTPLHFAVMQKPPLPNVMEIIKLLIASGADPDAVDKDGHTSLHMAPQFLTPELYAQLIEYFDSTSRGSSLKMVDNHNLTHLHLAVHYLEPLKSTLEIFKKHDLDFNGLNESGYPVLIYAIGAGRSASFINTLINFGADWTMPNNNHDNALHVAAYYSKLDALKMFISLGCDVNTKNVQGNTPLHNAVAANIDLQVINELIKHGANVNAQNANNSTPLHEALINHCEKLLELIRLFIDYMADVNARDSINDTPLHYAVTRKTPPPNVIEIIKLLIESGADPNAVDKLGRTFLQQSLHYFTPELYHELIIYLNSSRRGKTFKKVTWHKTSHLHFAVLFMEPLEGTLKIFKKHRLDFNAVDKHGNSVLGFAVVGGRSASYLNLLMAYGANWRTSNLDQENLLHCAAEYSNLDALKLFISLGCDVNASNLQGRTPLHRAVLSKNINPEVINELVKHGADINAQNSNENCNDPYTCTPLHVALFNHSDNQLELIQLLIEHQANVNAMSLRDYTPLHLAVMQTPLPPKHMEIIKLLIENGTDPDAVDKIGHTFLHWAPQFLTPELYAPLIEYFDSTSRTNSLKMVTHHNFTHLHCAVCVPNFEPFHSTLEIFKKHGLDFNALDNDGDSVVNCAIEGGRTAEFLQTLFTFGADWTILNKNLETAPHAAAYFGNLSALKLFLSFGFDVDSKNINGHTPLHNAFLGENAGEEIMTDHEVVYELLQHGADVNARDNREKLPIDLAKERAKIGKVEEITVKLLEAFST